MREGSERKPKSDIWIRTEDGTRKVVFFGVGAGDLEKNQRVRGFHICSPYWCEKDAT